MANKKTTKKKVQNKTKKDEVVKVETKETKKKVTNEVKKNETKKTTVNSTKNVQKKKVTKKPAEKIVEKKEEIKEVVVETTKEEKKVNVGTIIIIILAVLALLGAGLATTLKSTNEEKKEKVTLDTAGFNKVSVDEFINLVNSETQSIVLVARPTCYYCELFTPILKQAKDELNITINYVDTDSFAGDDATKFDNSLDYLKNEDWGTPLVLIVGNGTTSAQNSGYVELEEIKSFFKNNGFGA